MMHVLSHHLEELRRSGLSDETILRSGIQSETDPEVISRNLGWTQPARRLGPCIKFPFPSVDGSLNGMCRYKPDRPRLSKGKPVKYEQPKGVSPRAYFPLGTIAALSDPTISLGITEGEKKSLAADQVGCPCIGLCGV